MTIDRKLAELLRCPATGQTVRPASKSELEALNAAAAGGELKHVDGSAVEHILQAALVTVYGARAYPVRDGIPVMLEDECIAAADVLASA